MPAIVKLSGRDSKHGGRQKMKVTGLVLLSCIASSTPCMGLSHTEKTFLLKSLDDDNVVVPKGKIWEIRGLRPYESEKGIGTADIYIDGAIFIGHNRAYTIDGKFDICINEKQTSSIWLLEGTKIRIGDSRGKLVVIEHSD
ncbi:MAG: hypothetical protein JJ693_06220 [Acidithiobacillus sp.]|nr:hypothetical protein [Acidithiobacillus sp.]